MKKLLIIALLLSLPLQASAWYDTSFANRIKITFDNGSSSVALSNFPVLIQFNSSTVAASKIQSAGQDIRVVDSDDTTLLAYELEKVNPNGTTTIWAKKPSLATGTADFVYLYYNNPSATDAQNSSSVWTNYGAVYHLTETAGTSTLFDSTANSNKAVKIASTTPSATTTVIANGENFDGTAAYADAAETASLDVSGGNLSLEGWMYWDGTQAGQIFSKPHVTGGHTSPFFSYALMALSSNQKARIWITTAGNSGGVAAGEGGPNIATSTWTHLVGTYDSSLGSNQLVFYVNGVQVDQTGATGNITSFATPLRIGANGQPGEFWKGNEDELRISTTTFSASYITADYKTQAGLMNTFGAQESLTAPASFASVVLDPNASLILGPFASSIIQ